MEECQERAEQQARKVYRPSEELNEVSKWVRMEENLCLENEECFEDEGLFISLVAFIIYLENLEGMFMKIWSFEVESFNNLAETTFILPSLRPSIHLHYFNIESANSTRQRISLHLFTFSVILKHVKRIHLNNSYEELQTGFSINNRTV
jgi:hypothetical protein